MSRKALIDAFKRRLNFCRRAPNQADVDYWAGYCLGSFSAAGLLGAIEPEERERLDLLAYNAQAQRFDELRAQEAAA